MFYHI